MRYLIINIYDSWFNRSVCDNGKIYTYDDNHPLLKDLYDMYYDMGEYQTETYSNDFYRFDKLVLGKYGDSYDLIVICEDGDTKVLKGATNDGILGR